MKLMLPDFWTRKAKTNPLNRSCIWNNSDDFVVAGKDEWYFDCDNKFTNFLKFFNYLRKEVLVEKLDLLKIVDDIEAEFKIYLEQLQK